MFIEALVFAAVLLAAIAAWTDWRTGHIPNWLTLPPLVLAPVVYGLLGGWAGVATSALGLLFCGLPPYLVFRMGGMGGGDVKLLAALGAVLGWNLGMEAEIYAFGLGALFAIAKMAWERKLGRTLVQAWWFAVNPLLPKKARRPIQQEAMSEMRFGLAIFAGVTVAVTLRLPAMSLPMG